MRLSATHGYVGMYVVDMSYRGLGIGKQVWDAALKHLGSRNKGLSAVAHLFTLYRDKAGFSQVADWTVDLYRLDNMATAFHCKHHPTRHRVRGKKASIYKGNSHSLFEYYRNEADCQVDDCNAALGPFENECNFFCLLQEYKSNERKYLKQRKSSKSIEASDDESYGFSSLFFEEQSNDEMSDLDDESMDHHPIETITEGEEVGQQLAQLNGTGVLGCCLKLRHYCNSYDCSNGKLRTIVVDADNKRLVGEVVEYDRRLHAYEREQIVRLTLAEENCRARVALLGHTVVGYGCVKPNLQGMWIVSPLYADNEYVARILLLDMVTDLVFYRQYSWPQKASSSIVLKSPSNNDNASRLLEAMGFVKQEYSLRRCYTHRVFEVPTQAIYALHTSVFCTE